MFEISFSGSSDANHAVLYLYVHVENGVSWSAYISLHTMLVTLAVTEHGGRNRTAKIGPRNMCWSSESVS